MSRSKERIPVGGGSSPLAHSIPGLAALRDRLPAAPAGPAAPVAANAPAPGPVARAKKIVLRRERKGHGGKVATRIEGLVGSADELKTVCGDVRKAFGCGAAMDDGDLVVQGDQADRLVAWLQARGAARVVVGN